MSKQPQTYRTSEEDFLQQVQEVAKLYGWLCYHTRDSRRSNPGFPDLVLAKWEHPIYFAELKRDGANLTPEQEEWQRVLDRAATPFLVWRPSDWDKIVALLTGD